ncbi:MAG: helix-turn-helix transcriptional regulator [Rhodocyclales bacterium]|nr:helix-turn-helix transcriptional regulator [Rhodocyclales bacterium]
MQKFDFFMTGQFDAAAIRQMREQADKPQALFAIGQRLRETRKNRCLARSTVAARCGVSADQLGRFEHGMSDIGFVALEKYCGAVDADIAALLAPHMEKNADAVRTVIELARSWTGAGKSLSIEDVIGIAAAAP